MFQFQGESAGLHKRSSVSALANEATDSQEMTSAPIENHRDGHSRGQRGLLLMWLPPRRRQRRASGRTPNTGWYECHSHFRALWQPQHLRVSPGSVGGLLSTITDNLKARRIYADSEVAIGNSLFLGIFDQAPCIINHGERVVVLARVYERYVRPIHSVPDNVPKLEQLERG